MASLPLPATTPATVVAYQYITLSDKSPDATKFVDLNFTFPYSMIADPLTSVGPAGSAPDNNSPWWPYFQQRHSLGGLFWVQGHMLNHNVHGPGTTANLVPISNTLNTNMSAMVEEQVKKMVAAGKTLRYVVNAHWEGFGNQGTATSLADYAKHPEAMRKALGIKNHDTGGELLWGEQFAPTRLSWELYERQGTTLTPIALSRYGHDASAWNNHYPS